MWRWKSKSVGHRTGVTCQGKITMRDHYEDMTDHQSYKHNLSSLKKIWACTGFEPMTPAMPMPCSTDWAIMLIENGARCNEVHNIPIEGEEYLVDCRQERMKGEIFPFQSLIRSLRVSEIPQGSRSSATHVKGVDILSSSTHVFSLHETIRATWEATCNPEELGTMSKNNF